MNELWGARIEQSVLDEIESIRKSFLESLPRQVQPTHLMLVLPAIAWCVREIAALRKRHEVPYR